MVSAGPQLYGDPCHDETLIARAMAGDRAAFDLLAERHRSAVLRLARAQLGNYHDAEEVAQETFLRAWRSIHRLREPERFAAWLSRIVRSRCAAFAARWRQATLPLDGLLDALDSVDAPPDRAARAERDAVRAALEALTPPHRAAVELHYLAGYRIGEVAALLAVPAGTVKRRLHDSRARLRRRLGPFAARGQRRLPLPVPPRTRPSTKPTTRQEEAPMSQTPLSASGPSSRVDVRQFAAALARVAPIPGRPDRGHALNGIHLRWSGDRLTLSAADGFRLGRFSLPAEHAGGESEALVPVAAARGLLAVLRQETGTAEPLAFQRAADAIEAHLPGGWTVRLPLLEAEYPDLSRVIPATLTTRIMLAAADLRGAFALAAQFGDAVEFPFVLLDASPGQVRCHTRGPAGAALETSRSAEVTGPPGRTVLAKDKLLPLLATAEGELELGWEDPQKPVRLREAAAPASDCWVIMPGELSASRGSE